MAAAMLLLLLLLVVVVVVRSLETVLCAPVLSSASAELLQGSQ